MNTSKLNQVEIINKECLELINYMKECDEDELRDNLNDLKILLVKIKEARKAQFLVCFDLVLSIIYAIKNNKRIDEFYRADQNGKKN